MARIFSGAMEPHPADIHSFISDGKRSSPAARRQMARVLADEMRKNEANPTRAQSLTVCRSIARQYPNSFADQFDKGQLLGSGYTSLLTQVKIALKTSTVIVAFDSTFHVEMPKKEEPQTRMAVRDSSPAYQQRRLKTQWRANVKNSKRSTVRKV